MKEKRGEEISKKDPTAKPGPKKTESKSAETKKSAAKKSDDEEPSKDLDAKMLQLLAKSLEAIQSKKTEASKVFSLHAIRAVIG